MPCVCAYGSANGFGNLFASRFFTQEFDVFFPGKRHQHAHACSSTTIQKPAGRRMVNAHQIQPGLTHQRQIDVDLIRAAHIVSVGIRLERAVRHTFNKKLYVALEKKFRGRPNSRIAAHSGMS